MSHAASADFLSEATGISVATVRQACFALLSAALTLGLLAEI